MTILVLSIYNRSYSFLQIRTSIKAWMSLNSVKIPSPFMRLAALEHLKSHYLRASKSVGNRKNRFS